MKETQVNHTLNTLRNELGFGFKEQEEYHNAFAAEFPKDPFFLSQSTNKDFVFMEKTVFCHNWLKLTKQLNDYQSKTYQSIKSQIQLFDTNEEKAKFAADRIKDIQEQVVINQWNHILSINNFHLVINSIFIEEIFLKTFSQLDGKLYKWQTGKNPYQKWTEDSIVRKYQEIVQEDFFAEFADLLRILSEAKLLQILRRKLQEEKAAPNPLTQIPPNFDVNRYPKIFKSGYGCELFKYLVQVEDEKIGPAWASKYFDLFRDEKLIKKPSSKANFIRFLKKEFEIKIPELDKRASYTDTEMKFLKDLEKDFQKINNVNR